MAIATGTPGRSVRNRADGRILRAGLAFVWLATGLCVLHPHYRELGAASLGCVGLPPWLMWLTCAFEIVLGLRVLLGPASTWLVLLQLSMILFFTAFLSITEPDLLLDAHGALTKNLPLLAMLGTVWLLEREGWTPRTVWLLRVGMAVVWLTDGLVCKMIFCRADLVTVALLDAMGHKDDRLLMVCSGAAEAASAIGVVVLSSVWRRGLLASHVVALVSLLMAACFLDPLLWVHPFGPLTKSVPMIAGTLVLWRLGESAPNQEPV
jgi:uncharacterized membrane protein YphA (DoxX/SURF4 family)